MMVLGLSTAFEVGAVASVRIFQRGLAMAFLLVVGGCQSLPDNSGRTMSYTLPNGADTRLGRGVATLRAGQSDASGFYPLSTGVDALVARLQLVQAAEHSIDLQYYIWHRDKTGRLLAAYLLDAADRGVRVRILLDDMGSPLGDESLLMLDQHPNVEVRLFNPLSNRVQRFWSMLTEFSRVNRRMHNKSFTVDNSIAIVGGRNIGNEYFAAHNDVAFADLDLAVIGPVVDQVSDGFDQYWNHGASYAVSSLSSHTFTGMELNAVREQMKTFIEETRQDEYGGRLLESDLVKNKGAVDWFWGAGQVLYDHPDKSLPGEVDDSRYLRSQLSDVFAGVSSRLLLVSPYFVPGEAGVDYFTSLAQRGVQVTIVTNSLAATDVGAVHSGYAKYRKALLSAGIRLYEVRPKVANGSGKKQSNEDKPRQYIGSSAKASLHAKAFFIDGRYTFVGSMNLDPRSFLINTEIGILLDSAQFTSLAQKQILASLSHNAYELSLEEGDVLWTARTDTGTREVFDSEPMVSGWRHLGVWFMGLLPIESQL